MQKIYLFSIRTGRILDSRTNAVRHGTGKLGMNGEVALYAKNAYEAKEAFHRIIRS